LEYSGNWGAWFIITRTNKEVDAVIDKLRKKEIPYVTFKRAELDLSQLEALMTSNAVKVMTIHTAKGLESPNVIVIGAKTYSAEERRIAYVAATRAETNLYWCPSIKKSDVKGQKFTHWTKTKRVEQSAYGDIIEF
jgi:superfamily I DNA/RNA helicase